ncbi:MAG: hypothetical protein KDJ74_02470 [Notoacmeibacter sp.]|nr:hypothetical protein [Notoacmeibacter sp.]
MSTAITPQPVAPLTEPTEQGEQMLVAGVAPVTIRDRLTLMALRPIAPRRNPNASQKPCDHGLFDEVRRDQIDLIDFLDACPSTNPTPDTKE